MRNQSTILTIKSSPKGSIKLDPYGKDNVLEILKQESSEGHYMQILEFYKHLEIEEVEDDVLISKFKNSYEKNKALDLGP